MNKKNIRMAAFIVVGVVIWMLLGLFAPEERKFERPPAQKLTVPHLTLLHKITACQ